MAITLDNPNSMDGLQSRLESFIGKIKGHVELINTPELCGLVGKNDGDQISISTTMANDIITLLNDCMLGFSALELDAAQSGYAAEEATVMRQRIQTLTESQKGLITLLRATNNPAHILALRNAESLVKDPADQNFV